MTNTEITSPNFYSQLAHYSTMSTSKRLKLLNQDNGSSCTLTLTKGHHPPIHYATVQYRNKSSPHGSCTLQNSPIDYNNMLLLFWSRNILQLHTQVLQHYVWDNDFVAYWHAVHSHYRCNSDSIRPQHVFRLCNVQLVTLKTFCAGDISANTSFQSTHMKKKNNYRTLYFEIFQYWTSDSDNCIDIGHTDTGDRIW